MMHTAYLCLGGNIGDREFYITHAFDFITQQVGQITATSNIFETEAWGVENQQAYLNCCIEIKTELTSTKLINQLLKIEQQLGRIRTEAQHYQSRTIDIDILFYNSEVKSSKKLIVPHPRLHLRKFVLIPLAEIAPNFLHPILNTSIFSLLKKCTDTSKVILFKNS